MTSYVPQANDLSKVFELVRVIPGEGTRREDIASRFDLDARQVMYYSEAARELGLISIREHGKCFLTDSGRRMICDDEREANRRFAEVVLQIPVIRNVFRLVLDAHAGTVSRSSIDKVVSKSGGSRYGTETLRRRRDCVISWFRWLENVSEFSIAAPSPRE